MTAPWNTNGNVGRDAPILFLRWCKDHGYTARQSGFSMSTSHRSDARYVMFGSMRDKQFLVCREFKRGSVGATKRFELDINKLYAKYPNK